MLGFIRLYKILDKICFVFLGEKWICKICTLENGKDKNMCEVCGEPRPRSAKPPKPPLPKIKFPNITDKIVKDKGLAENPKQFQRQTSLKVESIREDDESKAIKEWQEIISLCREVGMNFNHFKGNLPK